MSVERQDWRMQLCKTCVRAWHRKGNRNQFFPVVMIFPNPHIGYVFSACIRLLNMIDDFNQEALGIEIDFSLPSARL